MESLASSRGLRREKCSRISSFVTVAGGLASSWRQILCYVIQIRSQVLATDMFSFGPRGGGLK